MTVYLVAKNHREFWEDLYDQYSKDPKKAKSVALAKQMRTVISELKKLERMG